MFGTRTKLSLYTCISREVKLQCRYREIYNSATDKTQIPLNHQIDARIVIKQRVMRTIKSHRRERKDVFANRQTLYIVSSPRMSLTDNLSTRYSILKLMMLAI